MANSYVTIRPGLRYETMKMSPVALVTRLSIEEVERWMREPDELAAKATKKGSPLAPL